MGDKPQVALARISLFTTNGRRSVPPLSMPSINWIPGVVLALTLAGSASAATQTFSFKSPHPFVCGVTVPQTGLSAGNALWLPAHRAGSTNVIQLVNRIVLQMTPGVGIEKLMAGRAADWSRTVAPDGHILSAPDAWTACIEAQALSALPEVLASYPVLRRTAALHGVYAATPNDTYFLPSGIWRTEMPVDSPAGWISMSGPRGPSPEAKVSPLRWPISEWS